MPERSKRHHYVPQLHLRAFAGAQERVATYDRRADRSYVQSVEKAAAENDYNTIRTPNGELSDEAEKLISELEGPWAPALQRACDDDWLFDPDVKVHLAHFVAFQYLRVPRQRAMAAEMAASVTKLDLAAGGPQRIRAEMEEAGVAPTDAEVLAEWSRIKDFENLEIKRSTERHLLTQFGLVPQLAAMMLVGYQWSVVRWERCALLASDDPVVLEAATDHPRWSGIGFATAGSMQLAIDRHTALLLANRSELGVHGKGDAPDLSRVPGTFAMARQLNQRTAAQASRYVFHHPDDEWSELLGDGFLLPPPRNHVLDPDAGVAMRDKLVKMSEWAFAHPDEPHPLSRLPSLPTPPPGARPVPFDGRGRRMRDMHDRLEEL